MKTSPYGLLAFLHWNHDWNNWHFPNNMVPRAAKQIKELGVGMVRLDIVWSDIHRGFRQYDFSGYDALIDQLTGQGLTLLVLLHYNKERLDASGKEVWSDPPESLEEFADYVGATVSRYKNKVKHWEIWNEPNHPVYWSKSKDDMKTYVQLLKLAYSAAKKADPDSFVINGGITEPVIEDVRNFYKAGGKNFTDAITIHTFLDPASPNVAATFDAIVDGVQKVMAEFGDADKKIWITEMGCPGVPASAEVKNWWAGKNLSEKQQADWLEKQFGFMKKHPAIEKMFWAFYRDTDGIFKDGVDYFGLVRFDLTPKPAYDRFQRLITSA